MCPKIVRETPFPRFFPFLPTKIAIIESFPTPFVDLCGSGASLSLLGAHGSKMITWGRSNHSLFLLISSLHEFIFTYYTHTLCICIQCIYSLLIRSNYSLFPCCSHTISNNAVYASGHGVKEPRRRSAKILTLELYQTGFFKTFFLASDDYLDQQDSLILVKSEWIR